MDQERLVTHWHWGRLGLVVLGLGVVGGTTSWLSGHWLGFPGQLALLPLEAVLGLLLGCAFGGWCYDLRWERRAE